MSTLGPGTRSSEELDEPVADPWWPCFVALSAATSLALWAADLDAQLLASITAYAVTTVIAGHGLSDGGGSAGRSTS